MKNRIALIFFALSLVVAPFLPYTQVHTWPGQYAKWTLPETRLEAYLLASGTPPPPPENSWCRFNPFWCQ